MPDMDKSRTPYVLCLKSLNPTVLLLCFRVRCVSGADGRRCANQSCLAGIAMGLVKEGDNYVVLSDFWATKITWVIWTSKLRVPATYLCIADGYQN